MSADEYASKELQQWRRAEAAKDIEAIKTHELDMIALGNTFVMKSHKGEQVIEKNDPVSSSTTSDALLPEDEAVVKDTRDDGPADVTWDHPNHGELTTQPLCDVCNGKMSLEDFVSAKLARESESSPKKKHKKSDRHRDRDRHRERHSSSSKSHSHSSSSKDKKHSKDKDRDKERDRSSHGKSSSDKKQSSSSKSSGSSSSKSQSSSSSKSKDKEKSSSSSSSKSSKDRERHRSSSSKQKEVSKSSSKPESDVNSTSNPTSELDELQARINKATAAIEAAKKSVANVENIGYQEEDHSAEMFEEPEENAPGSPIDLDLPDVVEVEAPPPRSLTEAEVTSTVTIPTPDQGESWSQGEEEPSVWEGQVIMQDVAKFSVNAFQVSGTSDYLRFV